MLKSLKKTSGITLIALIITVIVMLILAGVSINAIVGDNGIVTKSMEASFKTEMSQYLEDTEIYVAMK
jgi:Tfp pilus assembly protein PilE